MSPRMVDIPMAQEDLDLQASLKRLCDVVNEAEAWASQYDKPGLSAQAIRGIRRDAERAYKASKRRLCVGLFGPSQSGKSFLIGELGRGGELWLADAVDRLAARSTVIVQPIEGLWMAAGDPLRQLKANIEMALRREDMRDELITYLRSLDL